MSVKLGARHFARESALQREGAVQRHKARRVPGLSDAGVAIGVWRNKAARAARALLRHTTSTTHPTSRAPPSRLRPPTPQTIAGVGTVISVTGLAPSGVCR